MMKILKDLICEDDQSKVSKAALMLWIVFIVMLAWWIMLYWNSDKSDIPTSMQIIFGSLLSYASVKKGANAYVQRGIKDV